MPYVSKENIIAILDGIETKFSAVGTPIDYRNIGYMAMPSEYYETVPWTDTGEYGAQSYNVTHDGYITARVYLASGQWARMLNWDANHSYIIAGTQAYYGESDWASVLTLPCRRGTEASFSKPYDNPSVNSSFRFYYTIGEAISMGLMSELEPISASSEASTISYSLQEHIIGTWVDGKPLYAKTFQGTVQAGGTFAHDDVQRDVVSIVDTMWDGNRDFAYGVDYFNSSNAYTFFYYTHHNQYVEYPNSISVISNRETDIGRTAYVTLYYTKVSD